MALGKFEVFVGWKRLPDIQSLFTNIPTMKSRFLKHQTQFNHETLKKLVGDILSLPDDDITSIYNNLRSTPKSDFGMHYSYIPDLLPRLAEQYNASDPGTLIALLTMNYLVLQKGDAIYVPADGIHAYLSGDIVECMARSDNVLNTCFCPRAVRHSVELFTAALTFSPRSAEEAVLKPRPSEKRRVGRTKVSAPPMSEFDMLVTELEGKESETITGLGGPGILVVTGEKGC